MVCLSFHKTYFREYHLLMPAFIRFRSTCFSERLKVDALFIKQPTYFFLRMFLFKESPKKSQTFILTSMKRGNSIIAFHHVFILLFTPSLFKNFSLQAKHKDFDFFKAILSTSDIIFIKLIYIKGSFGFTFE